MEIGGISPDSKLAIVLPDVRVIGEAETEIDDGSVTGTEVKDNKEDVATVVQAVVAEPGYEHSPYI